MAILVDQPLWTFRGEKWSHLVSDSTYDELHEIANRVGIRRVGFQGDHYDLPARLLPAALDAGATQVDSRMLVKRLRAAGLRKPANYEGWTPLLRREAISIDDADQSVAELLSETDPWAKHIRETCRALWGALPPGEPLHQLFVLRRPGQLAVAFDTSLATKRRLHELPEPNSPAEIWVTEGNPLLAVDVLIDSYEDGVAKKRAN